MCERGRGARRALAHARPLRPGGGAGGARPDPPPPPLPSSRSPRPPRPSPSAVRAPAAPARGTRGWERREEKKSCLGTARPAPPPARPPPCFLSSRQRRGESAMFQRAQGAAPPAAAAPPPGRRPPGPPRRPGPAPPHAAPPARPRSRRRPALCGGRCSRWRRRRPPSRCPPRMPAARTLGPGAENTLKFFLIKIFFLRQSAWTPPVGGGGARVSGTSAAGSGVRCGAGLGAREARSVRSSPPFPLIRLCVDPDPPLPAAGSSRRAGRALPEAPSPPRRCPGLTLSEHRVAQYPSDSHLPRRCL